MIEKHDSILVLKLRCKETPHELIATIPVRHHHGLGPMADDVDVVTVYDRHGRALQN
jgi:hypothetical protein